MRRLLRPVTWCALLLAAMAPAATLACQWECAFDDPVTPHHAAHHDHGASAAYGTMRLAASGDPCEHPLVAAPAITPDAFKMTVLAWAVVRSSEVSGVQNGADPIRLDASAHGPPGAPTRSSVLRI